MYILLLKQRQNRSKRSFFLRVLSSVSVQTHPFKWLKLGGENEGTYHNIPLHGSLVLRRSPHRSSMRLAVCRSPRPPGNLGTQNTLPSLIRSVPRIWVDGTLAP